MIPEPNEDRKKLIKKIGRLLNYYKFTLFGGLWGLILYSQFKSIKFSFIIPLAFIGFGFLLDFPEYQKYIPELPDVKAAKEFKEGGLIEQKK